MLLEINPQNRDDRAIQQVVDVLKKGGIIIFPTDSVYSAGCDLHNKAALQKLARFKGLKLNKTRFSIICPDLSAVSNYVRQIDRPTFKLLKQNLPGCFTFILPATNEIAKLFDSNRREIGIRIPDNDIILDIVRTLGNALATTSLNDDEDQIVGYFTDPYEIFDKFEKEVDLVIDGGPGHLWASTVVNLCDGNVEIIRQGKSELYT